MSIVGIIILVFVLLLVFGSFPQLPHMRDRGWGYGPPSVLALVLVVVLLFALTGRI